MEDVEEELEPPLFCVCGHSIEEHGHDDEHPNSTACNEGDCDCIAYAEPL